MESASKKLRLGSQIPKRKLARASQNVGDQDEDAEDDDPFQVKEKKESEEEEVGEAILTALTSAHREEIRTAYNQMPREKMWTLSSGTIVEDELYRLGKTLKFEHAVHSFILDTEDDIIRSHF